MSDDPHSYESASDPLTDDSSRHPDSPGAEDEAPNDVTRARQQDLGHPHLDEELDRDELSDRSGPGQNSDWMPQ